MCILTLRIRNMHQIYKGQTHRCILVKKRHKLCPGILCLDMKRSMVADAGKDGELHHEPQPTIGLVPKIPLRTENESEIMVGLHTES